MEIITLFSLFLMGLSYGSTACMFSCMPFLTPLLVNNSKNFIDANKIVLPFTIGRIVSYISIAIFASSSTFLAKAIINDTKTTQTILGTLIILMSFYLLYRVYNNSCKCTSTSHVKYKPTSLFGSFFIGTLISLNPCVPVLTLVSFSASRSDMFEGFFMVYLLELVQL